MKFLKQKTLSRYSPSDNAMFTNQFGRAVMDLTGGLRLPKGTTAQRPHGTKPGDAPGKNPNGPNGFIRYNELRAIKFYKISLSRLKTLLWG